MKTLIISLFISFSLFSCTKEPSSGPLDKDSKGGYIHFTFAEEPKDTRVFFDNTEEAEPWEKSLSSITIYIFNPAGSLVAERNFTSEELSAKNAVMAIPLSLAGKSCDFYALANKSISGITQKNDLESILDDRPEEYNGAFSIVSTKSARPDGFIMTGSVSKMIGAAGTTTQVPITLKRSVAKIAVRTTVDNSFAEKYPGRLTVQSVNISGAARQTNLFYQPGINTGGMSFSSDQATGQDTNFYNSLFYIFENGTLPHNERVVLEITANYDADGNSATTTDISEVVYTVELSGTAATGKIDRNAYYRISVNIVGLAGDDLSLGINVAEWETPITQNINIGA